MNYCHGVFNSSIFAIVVSYITTFGLLSSAYSQQLSFDGDELDDIPIITFATEGDKKLKWHICFAATKFNQCEQIVALGQPGDHIIPGSFRTPNDPVPAIVRHNKSNDSIEWVTKDETGKNIVVPFGSAKSRWVSASGDLDGDGFTDSLIVNGSGMINVLLNPFSNGALAGNIKIPTLQVRNGLVWVYRGLKGDRRLVGARKTYLEKTKKHRYVFFSNTLAGDKNIVRGNAQKKWKPLDGASIRSAQGADFFLLLEGRGKNRRIAMYSQNKGKLEGRINIPNQEFFLVGNYLSDPGEEVALYQSGIITIVNPFNGNVKQSITPLDGIPIDRVNINSFTSNNKGGGGKNPGGNNPGGGGDGGGDGGGCGSLPSNGAVWKPEADHSVQPVFIEVPGPKAPFCRFERADGTVFMNFNYTGHANENRPHWRPQGGGGCSGYPSQGCMNCGAGKRYSIPNPCTRYD